MIKIKINVKMIDKKRLYVGKKGTYLNAVLIEKANEYGDDGFIVEDISREERAAGARGNILGNYRHLENRPATTQPKDLDPNPDADELPF